MLELCTDDLLFYVIQMPFDGVPELADRIVRSRDLALSVRAKRAAREIIEDMK